MTEVRANYKVKMLAFGCDNLTEEIDRRSCVYNII